ncbi:MAG: type II toxin-antitoxin system Phd/YefM family antitoxin [Cyanobium sp.]
MESSLPLTPALRVNVHEAKTQLSKLLQNVEAGQEVVIARAAVPVARLVPWHDGLPQVAPPGAMAGQIHLHAAFDEPLDDLFTYLPPSGT